jgi:hypothetical protein
MFSFLTPYLWKRLIVAIAAAPAPLRTTFVFATSLPVKWHALIKPARQIIAVPC